MKPEKFYEIELKALLTKTQHDELKNLLPKIMNQINEEKITTTRYRRNGGPEDVRLRHSDKTIEIVSKVGDVTHLARKEIKIPLPSKDFLDYFAELLNNAGFQNDPPWIKNKTEYETTIEGIVYNVCLQHIENFAYILEVEHISESDDSEIHEPNIKKIIKNLGCEPIDAAAFSERVNEYIRNKKVDY